MTRAFLYGTLRDEPLRRIVMGCEVAAEPAMLAGWWVRSARDGDWPTLVAEEGAEAPGLLTEPLGPDAASRFDWYEVAFDYQSRTVEVGGAPARLYLGAEAASTEGWSLAEWQTRWAPLSRIAAAETMTHYPARDPSWVAARWPQIRQRAASAVRAADEPAPATLRHAFGEADVEVVARRRPYTDYFSAVEYDLRFRRFDGGMSETVTRAALVSGDATTVLPYDPASDAVLLVEQFRFGPWARGDRMPWAVEAVAGRIDPGESAEEAARREAVEEAGLTLDRLEKVAAFYPSPGALAELIVSFVGLCDLSGRGGEVAGVPTEHENILSHVIPFERLMDLVASGEVRDAPLLLSAYWLAANRERLRGG